VTASDEAAPARLVVPTRPGLLSPTSRVPLQILVTGREAPRRVTLHWRTLGRSAWQSAAAEHLGRRTYQAVLGPFPSGSRLGEYYVSAQVGALRLTAPPGAPPSSYRLTLVD
jgi:hypothetical protein